MLLFALISGNLAGSYLFAISCPAFWAIGLFTPASLKEVIQMAQVELIIRKNGSTQVIGDVVIKTQDGQTIKPPTTPFSLCRCGASKNKPFCDGSHKAIGFDDAAD